MATSLKGVPPAVLLFAACTFWGIATVLNKALLGSISPVLLLSVQLFASTIFLWVACLSLRKSLPTGKVLFEAIVLGVLNPGLSYTFSMMGLDRISASVTSLLWATEPFLILALAWLVLREPAPPKVVAVIVAGFLGVLLVSGLLSGSTSGQTDGIGIAFLFLAVLLCAAYTVFSRWVGDRVDALALVTVQQTAGFLWSASLLAIVSKGKVVSSIAAVGSASFLCAMLTGLMYYAIAYWLYLSALHRVSATLAGGSFNVIPIVTVAVAFVFLGERLSGIQMFGAALIVLSATALFWLTREPMSEGKNVL